MGRAIIVWRLPCRHTLFLSALRLSPQAVTFKALPLLAPSLSGAGHVAVLLVAVVGEVALVPLVDVDVDFVIKLWINVDGERPPKP